MVSIRKSLAISFASQYIQIGLQLTSYFVLARLLTPNDIGLFSVASAAIGIAQVFRDFGMSSYLIQERELTPNKIATVFTLTVLSCIIFFSTLFLSAPWIAAFYKDDRLIEVFRLLAFNFLLIPLNSTALALMRRDMQFAAIFWIDIIAAIMGFIVAMWLSSQGYGYYSLIWSSIASTLAMVVTVSFFRRGGVFQRLTLCEWRVVLSFGSQMTLTSITSYIANNANDLIAGKLLGFTATGLISRAQGVMYLFARDITATIRGVAFPAFANAYRNGSDIETDYIQAVTILTAFAWPFYGFFSIYPIEALRLLFGPQWDEAGPLVPWFCAGGAIGATCSLIPTLLPALGGAKYLLRYNLLLDPIRVFTFLVVIYLFKTMEAFAIASFIFCIVFLPLPYYFKNKVLPTRYGLLMLGLIRSLLVSICALALPALFAIWTYFDFLGFFQGIAHENWAWVYKTPNAHYLKDWLLIPIGLLMIPCWVLGLIVSRHPLAEETVFKKIVFYRIGGKREK